jgi:hypothetical protein
VLPANANDALKDFQRRCKRIKASAELSAALRSPNPVVERLQSATKLLLEDKARGDGSLIDLSHRVEGTGSLLMVLFELIDNVDEMVADKGSAGQAKPEELNSAWKVFFSALPHVYALIRSSYDTTAKQPDGKDALALLVSSVIPFAH